MPPRKQYCEILGCENYIGTSSVDVHFFSPGKGLTDAWKNAINQHQGFFDGLQVCHLHFRTNEYKISGNQSTLYTRAIPSIFPVKKSSIPDEEETKNEHPVSTEKSIPRGATSNQLDHQTVCLNGLEQIHEMAIDIKEESVSAMDPLSMENMENDVRWVDMDMEMEMTMEHFDQATIEIQEEVQTSGMMETKKPISTKCDGCTERDVQNQKLMDEITDLKFKLEKESKLVRHYKFLLSSFTRKRKSSVLDETKLNNAKKTSTTTKENIVREPSPNIVAAESECNLDPFQTLFKCGTCGDCFQTANELRTHMKMHNAKPIKQFECIICKMELNTAKLLEKHMQSHGEERKGPVFSTCTVCREYVCEPHLCGEETQIDCAYCQQKYTSTKELITHLGIHSDDCKFYRCAECAKVFRMEFLLKNHEKYHTAHPKAFLCSICAKAFDSNAKLNQHTSTYHSNAATNQGERHLCEDCGKIFNKYANLKLHMATHKKEELQCPDCPKVFSCSHYLKRHRFTHRNCKYVCNVCDLEFTTSSGLLKHSRSHLKDGDPSSSLTECTLCLKKIKRYNLTKHMRQVHSNNLERLQCEFCSQSYKYKGDLNKHLRSHLGEKIYECDECEQRFKFLLDLRKHSLEHYKEQQSMQQ